MTVAKKESVELIAYLVGGSGKPCVNKQYPVLTGTAKIKNVYDILGVLNFKFQPNILKYQYCFLNIIIKIWQNIF